MAQIDGIRTDTSWGGSLVFKVNNNSAETNSTEVARINKHGLTFNGDTAEANALDDYEEGTFTPRFKNAGSSVSYSEQSGYYTKVGDIVSYTLVITCGNITSGSSAVQVEDLPFNAKNTGVYYPVPSIFIEQGFNATGVANGGFTALQIDNSDTFTFYTQQASTGNNYTVILYNMLNTGSSNTNIRVRVTGIYQVA